ncbi:MAG TPA: hypothetical protein VLT58_10900, partial [Polyangia bacterium]|nr:hypothetical protein [Polyangia bacterium]
AALPDCPDASQFRGQIVRQLGHDPFRDQAPHRLIARVTLAGGRLQGRVEWRDVNDQWEGERTFLSRNDSCDQMVRAMALATAIQIQLLGLAKSGAEEPAIVDALPAERPPPPPPPAPITVVVAPAPPPEPRVGVEVGFTVTKDVGGAPALMAPRIAVSLGRPSKIVLRLTASGLGPPVEVSKPEGNAQVDRLRMTLEAEHFFRARRRVQPFVTVGGGWQEIRVHGTSIMPMLGPAHDGRAFAGLVAAGGGVALSFASGLFVVLEAQGTLYWPEVMVQVGQATSAARFGGQGLLAHGGILARF